MLELDQRDAINLLCQELTEQGVRRANTDLIRRACNQDSRIREFLAQLIVGVCKKAVTTKYTR
jgi:hypothetical protein